MSFFIILISIAFLVLLITQFKINAFLAFLIISILAGILLGVEPAQISMAIQKGIGDMLGSLVIVVVCGAMLGKLAADSGAARQIASGTMKLFGTRYIQWAFLITGFIIGIPLFFSVGFVLVVPLIFSVAYKYKLPVVFVGLPMIASLSVTHGLLPPHPAPVALVSQFGADMGTTLIYGILIGLPTVVIAGVWFSKTIKHINPKIPETFISDAVPANKLPGMGISLFTSLLPVLLLTLTTIFNKQAAGEGWLPEAIRFFSDPAVAMIVSLVVATYTLGVNTGMRMSSIMNIYGDAVKDIAMVLLIMSGAGALKQVLMESGVSSEIGIALEGLDIHPLVLGWLMASIIRLCVGSATVAGLTAAGIIAPLVHSSGVDPNLMVISVGAGSVIFSHVNDSGFWLFKEYFNLSIKDTIISWSFMETVIAVAGLIGVMAIHYIRLLI